MIDRLFLVIMTTTAAFLLIFSILATEQVEGLEAQLTTAKAQILAHENHKCPVGCDEALEHYRTCACTKKLGGGE